MNMTHSQPHQVILVICQLKLQKISVFVKKQEKCNNHTSRIRKKLYCDVCSQF